MQEFCLCHSVEKRNPGKILIRSGTFDGKSTQNHRKQINSLSTSAAYFLFSGRSDSICSRTLDSAFQEKILLFYLFSDFSNSTNQLSIVANASL